MLLSVVTCEESAFAMDGRATALLRSAQEIVEVGIDSPGFGRKSRRPGRTSQKRELEEEIEFCPFVFTQFVILYAQTTTAI